ncbi:fatty acyl-CoA reductase [Amphritea balenae]|uniref:Dehydrogenase n=1 Tax=Amphritea balenae TaxID=452629 RepID=A0A3P1SMC2_9GAMM|nr:fatty acyl-CoA reductase [Amphritea balenae]RRC98064.1 dehydrogenase [Amphritea balenae]GGK67278.1 hypothetical protein GCM10007941_16700 [Amphritea balenae]
MNHTHSFSVFNSLRGKHLFVTGATGFLGKVTIEKLLREVPEVGSIRVLIRGTKSADVTTRFYKDMLETELFDTLKSQLGNQFESFISEKLIPVDGSLCDDYFGLCDETFSDLASSIDLIINSAASVNFREPLDQALSINTLSLHNISALAREGGKKGSSLPVVHISTCYVNGYQEGVIREEIHSPVSGLLTPLSENTYQISGLLDEMADKIKQIKGMGLDKRDERNRLTDLGIGIARQYGWNDTYTFTKWLGEQVLLQDLQQQNITIMRPSIIESAVHFPRPGWIEGIKVADAMIYAYGKSRLSVFPGKKDGILDIIPVDLVANATVLALAESASIAKGVRVYQCCSGKTNPLKLSGFVQLMHEEAKENYHQYPKLFPKRPAKFHIVSVQNLRFYMDLLTKMSNLKMSVANLLGIKVRNSVLRKLATTTEMAIIYGFYAAPKYRFDSSKLEQLCTYLSPQERELFTVRADSYQWHHYIKKVHLPGLHRYGLKKKISKSSVVSVQEPQATYKVA